MLASVLVLADSSVVTGAIVGAAAAFVVLYALGMTISHARLKPGRAVEFTDQSGRIQLGTVASYSWGAWRVRVPSGDEEYDVRVKAVKPK